MTSYIPKNAKHSAIQFTGDNRDRVCRFLGIPKENVIAWRNEDAPSNDCYLQIFTPTLNLGKISHGWWIVIDQFKREYEVLSDDEFQQKYERLGDG